jgi:hypothetical protein
VATPPDEDERETGELRRLREAKARFGAQLMAHPDVHGIGIGYKRSKGKKTAQLALVVQVHRKRPKEELEAARFLPSQLTFLSEIERAEVSVPIDVRERPAPVPEVECGDCAEDLGGRLRPVPGGYSGGLSDAPGGTLGGWVWDRREGGLVILSNEHVLGSNSGDTVIQPSIGDGGSSPGDDIGNVVRGGSLDASIAAPSGSGIVSTDIICSGPAVFEIADATLGMVIEKVGQTTGLTCGIVDLIDYDSGHYGSSGDLWIDGDGSDFSDYGDSGSLYVERENPNGASWKRVVGIHWGGSGNDGIGHPIGPVFTDLNLTTVCAGLIEALIDAILGREAETEGEAEFAAGGRFVPRRAPPRPRPGIRPLPESLARTFERRVAVTPLGSRLVEALSEHRADAVMLLLDGDGWRATSAALTSVLRGRVTTDEIFQHELSELDSANLLRVMTVARRVAPSVAEAFSFAEAILREGRGTSLGKIFFGEGKGPAS